LSPSRSADSANWGRNFVMWVRPTMAPAGYGTTASNPARSCVDILTNNGNAVSGVYYIQPPGQNTIPVYCDMTTDGGGWMRLAHIGQPSVTLTAASYTSGINNGDPTETVSIVPCSGNFDGDTTPYVMRVNMGSVVGAWLRVVPDGQQTTSCRRAP